MRNKLFVFDVVDAVKLSRIYKDYRRFFTLLLSWVPSLLFRDYYGGTVLAFPKDKKFLVPCLNYLTGKTFSDNLKS
jgi:hypothetical protein